jgi:hypothetical protein
LDGRPAAAAEGHRQPEASMMLTRHALFVFSPVASLKLKLMLLVQYCWCFITEPVFADEGTHADYFYRFKRKVFVPMFLHGQHHCQHSDCFGLVRDWINV